MQRLLSSLSLINEAGKSEGAACALWIPLPLPRGPERLIIPKESSSVTLSVLTQALIWISESSFLSLS